MRYSDTVACGSRWLAVFTKPRDERRAAQHLAQQGYPVYLPRLPDDRPLFPRYLFARCDATVEAMPIRSTRGVAHVLSDASGLPMPVPDWVIETVKGIEAELVTALEEAARGPRPGETVLITSGPMAGHRGLLQMTGERRAVVLLEMLGGKTRATVDASSIEAAT